MTVVLIVAATRPQLAVLADSVRTFHELGAQVHLAGTFHLAPVSKELTAAELDGVRQLPRSVRGSSALRRKAAESPTGMRVWLQATGDNWLRAQARKADVLVALDSKAVYTVWRLAQHNRGAEALYGITPALRAVEALRDRGDAAPRRGMRDSLPSAAVVARDVRRSVSGLPAVVMRTATARPVMRSAVGARLWRGAVTAPGVPARLRVSASRYVAEGMESAGRTSGAAIALAAAASKVGDLGIRASLLDESVMKEISNGLVPGKLPQAVAAQLAHADDRFTRGDFPEAATALNRALTLNFHRVVHIDQLSSPLARKAGAYVEPLYASKVMRALGAPRGRRTPHAPAPTGRPLRLLVTTSGNANFLHHILSHFGDHPGVELRFLDLAAQKSLMRISWAGRRILEDRLAGDATDYQEEVERLIRPYLDWADTVFLDWAVGPASMLTTIDPGDTRIVVRLHSYEAFTRWPHSTDFSRIDDLVFVAPHVRDLVASLVPQLRGEHAPRTHVIDNAMELAGFARPKPAEARFRLGLIGIGQVAKDPLWAIEVLRLLRKEDDRYRLSLVGGDMSAKTSHATRDYLQRFEKKLAPLVKSGAVERLGATDDVASALTGIGTILSSSVREGCHVGLMEGAASGALPVARDWPFYAGRPNSARTLYPEGWVVETPEEAAERIRRHTGTEEAWRKAGAAASAHALTAWDWPVVRTHFERLFLGTE
ncbi:glycosyltransferase family protein [Streptomyces paludis]|uniref:Glycosyltransferase family 1 protein n=1 Tax=Streptomyces paludis TaxID=2282738 RepID=A0A345HM99_9ACTN|nr:glycosyltransferase family 1 protein [Streptomyces paludis]AXG77823.1 glycosyltransferase family 1 protein [Streptomyces paludis]